MHCNLRPVIPNMQRLPISPASPRQEHQHGSQSYHPVSCTCWSTRTIASLHVSVSHCLRTATACLTTAPHAEPRAQSETTAGITSRAIHTSAERSTSAVIPWCTHSTPTPHNREQPQSRNLSD